MGKLHFSMMASVIHLIQANENTVVHFRCSDLIKFRRRFHLFHCDETIRHTIIHIEHLLLVTTVEAIFNNNFHFVFTANLIEIFSVAFIEHCFLWPFCQIAYVCLLVDRKNSLVLIYVLLSYAKLLRCVYSLAETTQLTPIFTRTSLVYLD